MRKGQERLKFEEPELLQNVERIRDRERHSDPLGISGFVTATIRNSLAVRRVVPSGRSDELVWTCSAMGRTPTR